MALTGVPLWIRVFVPFLLNNGPYEGSERDFPRWGEKWEEGARKSDQ
jgi:hypothetical protein